MTDLNFIGRTWKELLVERDVGGQESDNCCYLNQYLAVYADGGEGQGIALNL